MKSVSVQLGEVQETLLATLYARSVESSKKRPLLKDKKAVEMVTCIDYDFTIFDGSPTLFGSVLRTLIIDHWVSDFLTQNPGGTVVEVGAGLNSRFARVDEKRANWVDIDLPDSMRLRREFFSESERHAMVTGSLLEESWVSTVRRFPGPYFFIAEGVLLYFEAAQVRTVFELLGDNFPGAHFAFDSAARSFVDGQEHPHLRKKLTASLTWACDDPLDLEEWRTGLRLVQSRTLLQLPPAVRARLSPVRRCALPVLRLLYSRQARTFRVNLTTV